jgi:DNA-binding transcriptional regulator YiaG
LNGLHLEGTFFVFLTKKFFFGSASRIGSISHRLRMDAKEVCKSREARAKGGLSESGHLDRPLIEALRLFVELSGLRSSRVAQLMGVGEANLAKWLAGTVQPTQKKLQQIESFLIWHGREYLTDCGRNEKSST